MNIVIKTWNKLKYLIKFVTIAKREHLLTIKFILIVENLSFWATKLQHMFLIIIRQDFLYLAQIALHYVVQKRFFKITKLFLKHNVNVKSKS